MTADAPLAGRTAIVTGGGTGIGAACCRALAAEGFRLGVHYRSSEEAARKLRFNAQRTMRVAQNLYENGFITYMRTDSFTLSSEALSIRAASCLAEGSLP